jgi:hypothetical protein
MQNNTFRVEPGRVAYAGSYKLKLTKGGLFLQDRGSFDPIDTPNAETHLLRWLAKELANTGWASSVNARVVEANKNR